MKKSLLALLTILCLLGASPAADTRRLAITIDSAAVDRKHRYLERLRAAPRPAARPNVVLILADDLGRNDITLYGGPEAVATPHIDSLAAGGVTFTHAYCTSPICSPSRAGLLTGRYQQRYGYETQPMSRYPRNRFGHWLYERILTTGNWLVNDEYAVPRREDREKQGLPPSEINLAEMLGASGYATGIMGKWHLGCAPSYRPEARGFDRHYGFLEAFTLYAKRGDASIVNLRHDHYANHYMWRQERKGNFAVRSDGKVVDEERYLTFAIAEEAMRFIDARAAEPFFLYVPFSAPHTPFQAPRSYVERFAHIADPNRRIYCAMIAALDDAIGQILARLDERGLARNTVVMFASDNGGATYTGATTNAPFRGGKFSMFEGGLAVPLVIRWPGAFDNGATSATPVSLLDLFTTAAAAAGCALPDDRAIDGRDLRNTVADPGTVDAPLYWRVCTQKAVREGPWKLIIDERAGHTHLFDLSTDRAESHDLAVDMPERVQSLKRDLDDWGSPFPGPAWPGVMHYRMVIDGLEYLFPL